MPSLKKRGFQFINNHDEICDFGLGKLAECVVDNEFET